MTRNAREDHRKLRQGNAGRGHLIQVLLSPGSNRATGRRGIGFQLSTLVGGLRRASVCAGFDQARMFSIVRSWLDKGIVGLDSAFGRHDKVKSVFQQILHHRKHLQGWVRLIQFRCDVEPGGIEPGRASDYLKVLNSPDSADQELSALYPCSSLCSAKRGLRNGQRLAHLRERTPLRVSASALAIPAQE